MTVAEGYEMNEEELNEITKRRERELLEALRRRELEEEKRREAEERKKALARVVFSPEARQRLANLRLVKPQLVEQLETYLIALAQQGKLPVPLDDETLKKILYQLTREKRETKIKW
ncbi:MAG: DNA-binding protein [Thermoproteota archaeon]|jgi:programmed cell death protein 5